MGVYGIEHLYSTDDSIDDSTDDVDFGTKIILRYHTDADFHKKVYLILSRYKKDIVNIPSMIPALSYSEEALLIVIFGFAVEQFEKDPTLTRRKRTRVVNLPD